MQPSDSKSAVVLIEFQKQWTDPGLYHSLVKKQLTSRGVIANTLKLVEEARDSGVTILHAPLVVDPNNKRGWFAHLTFGKVFTSGTHKSEITPGFYQEGDPVVKGRHSFDAFVGSDFEDLLRRSGIGRLFMCGFTTDQCVAKTLRTALRKGFDSYLISDCTATVSRLFQQRTESKFGARTIESGKLRDLPA
jgi:nicotinamidase-related amidase